jgi:hypothetical protein
MEWNIGGTKFIELHSASSGQPISVNPAGISAFGVFGDGSRLDHKDGAWITLIGSPEDIHVSESYDQIKAAIQGEIESLTISKNNAYVERDALVCALSKLFPSTLERHPENEEWENDWRWIVFVELPGGQATWHIHDSELAMFDHLHRNTGKIWDGHNTPEKYARLEAISSDEITRLRDELVEAAQLHLADEQTVRNLEFLVQTKSQALDKISEDYIQRDRFLIDRERQISLLENELAAKTLKCPKCSHADIHTAFHRSGYDCTWSSHNRAENEHLHYYCRNCSYDWAGPIEPPEVA